MAQNTPSFNFYSSDFLTGTMFMEDHEVGKYAKLMCAQHQNGHLTLAEMEVICKGPVPARVMAKYKQDDRGLYYNRKLDKVIAEKNRYCQTLVGNLGDYAGKSREEIKQMKQEKNGVKKESPSESPVTVYEEVISESPPTDPPSPGRKAPVFKPPTVEELIAYFKEHGFDEALARRVHEGYEVADWHDSKGSKIKNWKQKMIQVWFKDEHRIKNSIDKGQRPGQVIVSGDIKPKFNTD